MTAGEIMVWMLWYQSLFDDIKGLSSEIESIPGTANRAQNLHDLKSLRP